MGVFDRWQGLGTKEGAALLWRARVAMGGEGGWSIAELGLDEADFGKLRQWIRHLTPSRVTADRIFMPEDFGTAKQPFKIPSSACFGLLLLAFASELVRREPTAEPGTVWPTFARAIRDAEEATRRGVEAEPFLHGDQIRSWVRDLVEQAASWFQLRRHPDAAQRWMHLVSLQAGFFGDCRTVAVQLVLQRTQSVALLVEQSGSFARLWQALLGFRARHRTEDDLRHVLAQSPWVLPGQIDPLVGQAILARAARAPLAVAEAFVDDPHVWLHGLLGQPRFDLKNGQLRLMSALAPMLAAAPVSTLLLLVGGTEAGRAVRVAERLTPVSRELVWPRVAPTVRCDLVSRSGDALTSVAFELWSDAADDEPVAGVVDLGTGFLVGPGQPLPRQAGLLVEAGAVVSPSPVGRYKAGDRELVELPPDARAVTVALDGVVVWSSTARPPAPPAITGVMLAVTKHARFDDREAVVEVRLPFGWTVEGGRFRQVKGTVETIPDDGGVTRLRFAIDATEARPSTTVTVTLAHPQEGRRIVKERLSLAHGATREIAGRWNWIDPAEELDVDERLVVRFLGSPEVPDAEHASLHPFLGLPGGVSAARPRALRRHEVFTHGVPLVAWAGQPPWSVSAARSYPIARAVVAQGHLVDFAPSEGGDGLELFLRAPWEPPKDTFARWLHADGSWGDARLTGPESALHILRADRLRPSEVVAVRLQVGPVEVGIVVRKGALDRVRREAQSYWVVRSFGLPIARDDLLRRIDEWLAEDAGGLQAAWLLAPADAFDDQGRLVVSKGAPSPFTWADVAPEPMPSDSAEHDRWLGRLHALPSVFTWPSREATYQLIDALLPVLGQPIPGVPMDQQINPHPIVVRVGKQLLGVGSRAVVGFYDQRGEADMRVFYDWVVRPGADPRWVDGQNRARIDVYTRERPDQVPAPLTREQDFTFYVVASRISPLPRRPRKKVH